MIVYLPVVYFILSIVYTLISYFALKNIYIDTNNSDPQTTKHSPSFINLMLHTLSFIPVFGKKSYIEADSQDVKILSYFFRFIFMFLTIIMITYNKKSLPKNLNTNNILLTST